MTLDPKENHDMVKDKIQKERRVFLKKAAYAAPTLIIMGELLRPNQSKADFGPTPYDGHE